MKDFVNKFSLYDILSMVIPGGTIFVFLSLTLGYKLKIDKCVVDPVLGWTIALVLSYLLGLINHVCTAQMWEKFRDNHMLYKEKKLCWRNIFCDMKCVFILIVFMVIIRYILKPDFPRACLVLIVLIFTLFLLILSLIKRKDNDNILQVPYYKQYYYVMKHRYNDDIPIMESQVAFMQNMLIPLALFLFVAPECVLKLVTDAECCLYKSCFGWMLILLYVALIIAVLVRQDKIVYRVKTDYMYLKQLEKHEENHK